MRIVHSKTCPAGARVIGVVMVCGASVGVGCARTGSEQWATLSRDANSGPVTGISGSAYAYQPVNPLTVWITDGKNVTSGVVPLEYKEALLNDFSSDASRIAVAKIDGEGSLSFGPVSVTTKGQRYSLIVDYIKYMTWPAYMEFRSQTEGTRAATVEPGTGAGAGAGVGAIPRATEAAAAQPESTQPGAAPVFSGAVPVYVGIGVRIRADYVALESGGTVNGLPGLGAAAHTGMISGCLSVQTLGISGRDVSPLMPINGDLSMASIQAAVQAAAAIKAKLYEDSTVIQPMIVGFETPLETREGTVAVMHRVYQQQITLTLNSSPRKPVDPKKDVLWFEWPKQAQGSWLMGLLGSGTKTRGR